MSTSHEQNLPCLNPNCKSHGRPHPNCRCNGFAKGGSVGHFCAQSNEHNPDCQYFSGGGAALSPEELEGAVPIQSDNQKPLSDKDLEGATLEPSSKQQALSPEELEGAVPFSQESEASHAKYGSGSQQAITALEGAAQGLAGPLATWAETHVLGVKPEDIAGRAKENPWIHGGAEAATFAGSMLYGVGEAALIAKTAAKAAELSRLGAVGAQAVKLGIEGMMFTGSDEITKAMLNQHDGDPSSATSAALLHVGASGLLSAATGGVFNLGEAMIGKGLKTLGGEAMSSKAQDLLYRIATNGDTLGELGLTDKATSAVSKAVGAKAAMSALALEPVIGTRGALIVFSAAEKAARPTVQKVVGWGANKINPYVTSAVFKTLMENEISGLPNAVHYATQIWKGAEKARIGISSCFAAPASQIALAITDEMRNELKSYVEDGQLNEEIQNSQQESSSPQAFAKGGISEPSSSSNFSKIFPEQNVLLSTAKGRISNYLNSIRPLPNQAQMPFDKLAENSDQKRSYDKAIDIALSPLSVLDHINKGSLTAEHMKHFSALYPEAHAYLSKEMTKKITEAQLKKQRPPYSKRLGMSMFLGATLDSTMTPLALQTIQGVYAQKQAPQPGQPPVKNKKGTSSLSKISGSHLTDDQAHESRLQKV